jgi:membrane protein implicated in regulation of membrane protease activity
VSKHRRGAHRAESPPRVVTTASDAPSRSGTSITEIAVYGLFAAVVAGAVLVVGGQPRSYAVAVVVGAVLVVAVLALVSARTSRTTTAAANRPDEPSRPVSTASRRGRRRRR